MEKIKGLTVRRLGKEYVIVAESLDLISFDKLVTLNEPALYVWESLPRSGFDLMSVVKLLLDRYNVAEDVALSDSSELIGIWERAGIICR